MLALSTDFARCPDRTKETYTLASADVNDSPAGFGRRLEEARTADLMACAGISGANLPDPP
ncbi:MAG: hypothetical protein ACRYFU_10860 [Janthinobacterium lividum]